MNNTYLQKIQEMALPNKYLKYYVGIISKALGRPQNKALLKLEYGYVEKHHILPKSFGLGGSKDSSNTVFLTAREHFIVHACASKMFTGKYKTKMVFAFYQFKCANRHQQERYFNSRLYSAAKLSGISQYIRLYLGCNVKYVHVSDLENLEYYKSVGWSEDMTQEFKKNVGNMHGKKHSIESRDKISKALSGKTSKLKGRHRPKEVIEAAVATKMLNKGKYQDSINRGAQTRKRLYETGALNVSGENNPMYGKTHSQETRNKISDSNKKIWKEKMSNEDMRKIVLCNRSKISKKMWENRELRGRASVYNSFAFKKYNMLPQEYYDKKIKPLLYLGFLPTSIEKYQLLEIGKHSIKRLVYKFGSPNDIEQFEKNKEKAKGSNKAYRDFLEKEAIKFKQLQ